MTNYTNSLVFDNFADALFVNNFNRYSNKSYIFKLFNDIIN